MEPTDASPPPEETAVIVVVPAAEPAVGPWRSALDRSAGWGVPAHVTVLYPFVPADQLDDATVAATAEAVASVPAFDVAFTATGWFGDTVLWLAPDPAAPFLALTRAVWDRFPQFAPYGGAHDTVVPHLTVGHDAPIDALRDAETALAFHLPIRARITTAMIVRGAPAPDSWHPGATLPLA